LFDVTLADEDAHSKVVSNIEVGVEKSFVYSSMAADSLTQHFDNFVID